MLLSSRIIVTVSSVLSRVRGVRPCLPGGLLLGVATAAALTASAAAQPDEFVKHVNDTYKNIAAARRSDSVLLTALAKLDPPPSGVSVVDDAALLPAGAPAFKAAGEWAKAPAQQAALAVLVTITKESDFNKSYAFGQPYGADAVEPAMVRAKMYTELGDPPTLAAGQHLFAPALDRMACLVNVEATRLVAEGKPAEAMDLLINWVYFGRQMADRAFSREVCWGLKAMAQGLERVRDLGYGDMLGSKGVKPERIRVMLDRLAEEGYTSLSRMTFPQGDRAGAEQAVARVFHGGAKVDEKVFAPTMARLGSAGEPLRLFSEASRWRAAAGRQADGEFTRDRLKGLFEDWNTRWNADWFDRVQTLQPEYERLDRSSLAVLTQSVPDLGRMLELRQVVRTELVGTRASLALLAHAYTQHSFAPQFSAIRPLWLVKLEIDPFNPNRVNGPQGWLTYMVPMRDTPKGPRGEGVPYEISVVTNDPLHPVTRKLTDDTFLLVSMGSNAAPEFGKRNQNTAKRLEVGADYLLFPPVISLQRQVMVDAQFFK